MAHEMAHAIGPHLMRWSSTDAKYAGAGQATWVIEGFARWVEHLDEPGSAARGLTYVRHNKAKYQPSGADLPGNPGFHSADNDRTTFNYELSAAVFTAVDKIAGRQKAVDLYISLTNDMQNTTDTRLFLNDDLTRIGIDPQKLWRLMP
jgi:hypothetical protein